MLQVAEQFLNKSPRLKDDQSCCSYFLTEISCEDSCSRLKIDDDDDLSLPHRETYILCY